MVSRIIIIQKEFFYALALNSIFKTVSVTPNLKSFKVLYYVIVEVSREKLNGFFTISDRISLEKITMSILLIFLISKVHKFI